MGRIYIPKCLFDKYGVDRQSWLASQPQGDWQSMLDEIGQRANRLYQDGWPTIRHLTPRSGRMFSLIWHSYHGLLQPILAHKQQLWTTRKIRLPKHQRLRLLTKHALAPSRMLYH